MRSAPCGTPAKSGLCGGTFLALALIPAGVLIERYYTE
jgi:hypothetical protein